MLLFALHFLSPCLLSWASQFPCACFCVKLKKRREGEEDREDCKMVMVIYRVALVFILFGVVSLMAEQQQLSTKECEALGFTGLALCSDCNTFAEYVKDQGAYGFLFKLFFLINWDSGFWLFLWFSYSYLVIEVHVIVLSEGFSHYLAVVVFFVKPFWKKIIAFFFLKEGL